MICSCLVFDVVLCSSENIDLVQMTSQLCDNFESAILSVRITYVYILQKQDGYFNTKCFTSVSCVVTHLCK